MPRAKSQSKDEIIRKAMALFWDHGYEALSMDILVKETGSSRHAIYSDFGGKRELFIACLQTYQEWIVTPAFAPVEEKAAGLEALEAYFDERISFHEASGLPGPGCLIANTMTEIAPRDEEIMGYVCAYNQRLEAGFLNVLTRMNQQSGRRNRQELEELASLLVIATQGLWSASRTLTDITTLRRYTSNLIYFIEAELNR